ncbi:MAG: MBL fold metallo-hydrolase, partial [Bacteroidales bacterium]
DKTVFSGDVLFYGSIGRSDLPTGDYDQLKKSIHEQLFTLADDFTVRPGHGGRTTIEHERKHNPFLG